MTSNNLRKLTPRLDEIKKEFHNVIRQSKIKWASNPIIYDNYKPIFSPRIMNITPHQEFVNMIEQLPEFVFPQKYSPEQACISDIEYLIPYSYNVKYKISYLIQLNIEEIMNHFNEYTVIYHKSNSIEDCIYLTKNFKSILDKLYIGTIQVSEHSRAAVLEYYELDINHTWPVILPSFDTISNRIQGLYNYQYSGIPTSYLNVLINQYNNAKVDNTLVDTLHIIFTHVLDIHTIEELFEIPDLQLNIAINNSRTHIFLAANIRSNYILDFIKENKDYEIYSLVMPSNSIVQNVTGLPSINNISVVWHSSSGSDILNQSNVFLYKPIFYHRFTSHTTFTPHQTNDKNVYEYSTISDGNYNIICRYLLGSNSDQFVETLDINANYLISNTIDPDVLLSFSSRYTNTSNVPGYIDCKVTVQVVNVIPSGHLISQIEQIINATYSETTNFIFADGTHINVVHLDLINVELIYLESILQYVAIIVSDNEIKSIFVSPNNILGLNNYIMTLSVNKTYYIHTNIIPPASESIYWHNIAPNVYQVMRYHKYILPIQQIDNTYNEQDKYVLIYINTTGNAFLTNYYIIAKYILIDDQYLSHINDSSYYLISKLISSDAINAFKSSKQIQSLVYENDINIQFMKYEPSSPTLRIHDISGENAIEENDIIPYIQSIEYGGYDAVIIGGGYSKSIPAEINAYNSFISNVFATNNLPNFITIISSDSNLTYGIDVVILSNTYVPEINSYINNYINGQGNGKYFIVYTNYELVTNESIIDNSRYLSWVYPIISNGIYKYTVHFTIVTIININ